MCFPLELCGGGRCSRSPLAEAAKLSVARPAAMPGPDPAASPAVPWGALRPLASALPRCSHHWLCQRVAKILREV